MTALRGVELPRLFQQRPGTVSLSGGLPDLSVFPMADFAELSGRLLRLGGRTLLQYTTPHVSSSLLPAIAELAEREAICIDPGTLVPTAGSQQGLAAVARIVDCDTVMCETPAYPGALAAFAHAGLQVEGVSCDSQGVIVEDLCRRVVGLRDAGRVVRALYVVPTFANPTGATQSAARRRELVNACSRLGLLIIEDNPYGLLDFEGRHWPALKSLDPERVVYLGTFSKVFAPGLRAGWIDAPSALVAPLRTAVEVLALSPSAFVQAAIGEFHRKFGWAALLDRYRASYAERAALASQTLRATLDDHGTHATQWVWDEPRGGFYLWLTSVLPTDAGHVALRAAEAGVSVVPGPHFGTAGEHASSIRVCYANAPLDKLRTAATQLAHVLAQTPVAEEARS